VAGPQLAGLAIADPPERWAALGFAIAEARVELGGVSIELGGPGSGITGWTLTGLAIGSAADIDGLRATQRETATVSVAKSLRVEPEHPNRALGIDHVVIVTPDFDRTSGALDAAGLTLKRIRQAGDRRQGFRRIGPTIMEIVEAPEADAPGFWGLTVTVADLEAARDHMGGHLGEARPAVQPGRHIATVGRAAGLSTRMALMDPG
jgi:catechol 2,3-dioxygenase-like lactoylglutathione lyase family enzyme